MAYCVYTWKLKRLKTWLFLRTLKSYLSVQVTDSSFAIYTFIILIKVTETSMNYECAPGLLLLSDLSF